MAIGISTGGGSANILSALAGAGRRGLLTVGIVGYDGGRIVGGRLADHAVAVRSDYIPRIKEVQASIYYVPRAHRTDQSEEPALARLSGIKCYTPAPAAPV